MFIDSHCHINFPDLISDLDGVIQRMSDAQVEKALCVSVSTKTLPEIIKITNSYANVYGSAGVHPNEKEVEEPALETLINLSANEKIIAIGETGLDYFRSEGDMSWQQERFRRHIRCAKEVGKPLIIHTREAPKDTIRIMKEEGAAQAVLLGANLGTALTAAILVNDLHWLSPAFCEWEGYGILWKNILGWLAEKG